MYKFSSASQRRLETTDKRIQQIMNRAIMYSPIDFGIPQYGGKRDGVEQNELFKAGKSKLDGFTKKSKHQTGLAIDVFAYIDGKASWEKEYYFILAGVIMSSAKQLGYELRWGGCWAMDWKFNEEGFMDYVHWELINV